MSHIFQHEINLLCVGDLLSGKSSFLEAYTCSRPQSLHYKVYPHLHKQNTIVYLHEVEERLGMDAYLSYPYDGVLYFLNIHEFHNPCWAILDQIAQISKLNGQNIYTIPIKLVVLSSKQLPYYSITENDKQNLVAQLSGTIKRDMIIFVQDEDSFQKELEEFYDLILNEEAPGISQNWYVSWQLRGTMGLIPLEVIMLNARKVAETLGHQWIKFHAKVKDKYQKMHKLL